VDIYSIGLKVDSRQVKQAQGELGRFGQQSKKTGDSVKRFGRQVDRSAASVKRMSAGADLAKRAVGGLIAALSVRQLQQFVTSTIAAADAIDNAARTAGVGAERLQELRFAFGQLVGTTDKDVDAALRRFNRRLGEAQNGAKGYRDALTGIGVAVDQETQPALEAVLQNLAQIESTSERSRVAAKLFGEDAGPALAAALGEGIDAMDDAASQAVIMSNEIAASGSRIQDDIDKMASNINTGLQNAFLGAAVSNEEQIRSLIATILRGMATVADFGDEVSGPLGAGLLGRVLFGKKGAVIGTLLTSAVQTVNALIERVNETSGQAILRLEERAQQLQNTIQGLPEIHPVRQAAEADLERVQSKLDDLNAQRMSSIEIENQYQKALKNTGDIGEDVGDILREAARQFEAGGQPSSVSAQTPQRVSDPENLPNVIAGTQDLSVAMQEVLGTAVKIPSALDAASTSALGLSDIAKDMTDDLSNGLTDIIMQAKSAEEVFASLAKQIARTIIQQQIADPLAGEITGFASGLFGGGGGGIGAPGSDVGSGGGFFSGIGDFFGGFFANGGNISGGKASIVGERGPELFVPGQDGQIVPNHQMGGGGNVTVNVINQGGEQLEAQQQQTRRGPNGDTIVDVMVKKSMERLDSQGQLDGIFNRHGARRQGQF